MPSVTQDHNTMPPSKKRRRDNDSEFEAMQLPFSEQAFHGNDSVLFHDHASTAPTAKLHPHHQSPIFKKMMALRTPTKRQRVSGDGMDLVRAAHLTKSPIPPFAFKELQETDATNRSAPGRTMLNRCHICNRKPTKKSDLDAFADCQGCGQRTCFICIRQCNGWQQSRGDHALHGNISEEPTPVDLSASITMEDADEDGEAVGDYFGQRQDDGLGLRKKALHKQEQRGWGGGGHQERVCSGCCVERGTDGDVVCLGCLAFVEG